MQVAEPPCFKDKSLNFARGLMHIAIQVKRLRIPVLILLTGLIFSCSPTRRLHEGEYLLVQNKIVEKTPLKKGDRDNISNYVQQKPNRKVLGIWRFYLQTYNLPNPDKLLVKKEKQLQKLEAKNKAIEEYNKTVSNPRKKKKLKKEHLLFGEWLQKIGEPPVILDTFKVEKSSKQLTLYAKNKGYFQTVVTDTIVYKKKKATARYFVNRGPAYYVDSLNQKIEDTTIARFVKRIDGRSFLKKGMKYDMDKFEAERERITNFLRNQGYFMFTKDFIRFEADTTVLDTSSNGTPKILLTMVIRNPDFVVTKGTDTIHVTRHKQFLIRDVYVISDFRLQSENKYKDTVYYANYKFLYNDRLKYNPKILAQSVFFDRNQFYQTRNEEKTQRNLAELRNFKYIHLRYETEIRNDQYDLLDVYVELSPTAKQNLAAELQGTNTEGNLGISLGLSYQNKNIFKGTEVLEFRVTAGVEVQVIQGDSSYNDTADFGIGPFNTLEVGAQISLVTSRFLFPIKISKIKKWARPKTRLTLAFNYQRRPDYERLVGSFLFGYEWTATNMRNSYIIKHVVNPIEVSVIKIFPHPNFEDFLNTIDDQFARNSFKDHFILGASYTFTYNNQNLRNPLKNFFFIRANGQIGGNLLSLISLIGKDDTINGYHTVFNIQYAQYFRIDFDFRYYMKFRGNHSFNTRAYIGTGLPYGNSTVLPFEKSFYVGGANDLRGWLPRTLGPGTYRDTSSGRVDQVGDIKLLLSLEYRFQIYKFLEGALFADCGNIWLIRQDAARPNGEFRFDRFWNQFAMDVGIGIRLNFNFFVFRLDYAIPLRDPTFPDPWVAANPNAYNYVDPFTGKTVRPFWTHFNIAIGYPF